MNAELPPGQHGAPQNKRNECLQCAPAQQHGTGKFRHGHCGPQSFSAACLPQPSVPVGGKEWSTRQDKE